MGVPAFYKWLINKYPNTVVNAVEEKGKHVDSTSPNPNGMEFDNLYLDMNGIIHPCFHPDDHPFPPVTFEEVFENMIEYIDRLFNIVRPRKLLYMAIDGVAPRAKMNQQRARRFQTSKRDKVAEKEEESLRIQFQKQGKEVLLKAESKVSDSNVITPGTEFMYRLSKEMQSYIRLRINNDPGWKDIKVILSDANVPGEGEHKIMSFIRLQRTSPEYNPNMRHCLYGLDADLIMLALATHEVHFSVLRENVHVQEEKPSCETALEVSLQEADQENGSSKSSGWSKQYLLKQEQDSAPAISGSVEAVKRTTILVKKPYQFLRVWILREYLELDMQIAIPPEKFDLERVIDDFIFICFFVGNDFLPHMPTLEIHEGAIDLLMHIYKKEFNTLGDYLVDTQRAEDKNKGYIKLSKVEKFILKVGSYEEKIFKKRLALRDVKLRRIHAKFEENRNDNEDEVGPTFETNSRSNGCPMSNVNDTSLIDSSAISDENRRSQILQNTKELKEKLKNYIGKESDAFKDGSLGTDKVRLGSPGWKERYYKHKFSAESLEEIESTRKSVKKEIDQENTVDSIHIVEVEKYTEGLCWVLEYYFSGVPSWTWFYPFYYGPFVSDMKGLAQTRVKFQKGSPFKPFDQLLSVLPPRSAHALPLAYQPLMSDENSEIIDFYPTDFEVDMDGKRFMWQGTTKLSFIDEERLLAVTRKLEKELNEDETMRNARNIDQLFVRSSSQLVSQILPLSKKQTASMNQTDTILRELDGFMGLKLDNSNAADFEDNIRDNVLCLFYELPPQSKFIPRLLEGVNVPEKTISESDIEETQLWHEYQRNWPSNRTQYQQRQPCDSSKSISHKSSPVLCKPVGRGFTAGRGKPITTTAPPITNRIGFCTGRIQERNISDRGRGFNSYGRARQVADKNVWTPRKSFSTSVSNGSHEERQNVQSNMQDNGYNGATTSAAQGHSSGEWGPSLQTNVHESRYFGAPTSVQGRGGGEWGPSLQTNVRESRYFGAPTSVQGRGGGEWGPSSQTNVRENRYFGAPTSIQGRGGGEWGPSLQTNVRENRYFGAPTSVQGRGGGEWGPSLQTNVRENRYFGAPTSVQGRGGDVWGRNLQSNVHDNGHFSAPASTQGRGRGQFVTNGNASGTNWKPRKYNVNSGAERDGRR